MNCVQICLVLATSCLTLISVNAGGSYNYAYGVNDPITGDLKDHRETKVCDEQIYDESVLRTAQISREPIISTVSSEPIINTEFVSATPSSILRTADFESSRILTAAPILETKVEPEPLLYAPRPVEYAPLAKYATPIAVTAAPMLETKIAAEPLLYAPLPKLAPLPKYTPRTEYYSAPLIAPKILQSPIVQFQAAPVKIIKSAKLPSYGHQSTSFSHKSYVNHPPTPVKIATIAPQYYMATAPLAPEYYAPAPKAQEYYSPAPKAQEYYAPAPKAQEYYAPAPKAQEYYAPAPKAQEYYAPAPKAQEYYAPAPKAQEYYAPAPKAQEYYAPAPKAQEYYAPAMTAPEYNSVNVAATTALQTRLNTATQAQIAQPLQQATRALYVSPAQYVYRSSSAPATSYQYANHWKNYEQSAGALQSRYYVASPQQYSAQQLQYESVPPTQNSGQYVAAQEQPCEKALYSETPLTVVPSIPARRNPGPPVIGPRPAQYKLPPPPRATNIYAGDLPTDRQTIRGCIEDHPKDVVVVQQQSYQLQQPQQPQQPQPQPPQQQSQPQQQPQLRARRFKVPPPIKWISEPLDGGSRESYEMMTPAMTMSPNRQDSGHWSDSFSVNSSPGYSTKSMETPLLSSHAKLIPSRSNKKRFILDRYVVCDQWNGRARFSPANSGPISSSSTAELTKSHSTPASLQAVVEFNENSPNSLQHRVLGTEAIDVTEVFIRLQRRQVVYNIAILIFITVLLICFVRVGLPSSGDGQMSVSKTASTIMRNTNVAVSAVDYNNSSGSPFKTISVDADLSSVHAATTDPSSNMTAFTPKKNYVPIILPNPPAVEDMYDVTIFNPMYPIVNYPKSTCLPSFCQNVTSTLPQYLYNIPYKTEYDPRELIALESVVNVRCYELTALYFCALLASKGCGDRKLKPCQSLCKETIRSCGFFFDIFEAYHEHRDCTQFPNDSNNPNTYCIGHREVVNVRRMKQKGLCREGFRCDKKRCIPMDWKCDGHFDCEDHSDELKCSQCPDRLFCGAGKCIAVEHICNGVFDCEWGQDERNCVRLSGEMGVIGEGMLELYSPNTTSWRPACIQSWDSELSATIICNILGYKLSSRSILGENNKLLASVKYNQSKEYYDENKMTVYREIRYCPDTYLYPSISLLCSNFECGVRRRPQTIFRKTRIVGGRPSLPGDWPFLAAILGGPDEIFYCAGVLISEQWVLTAAHCTGGRKILGDLSEWTIQLGMTRRHSHSFFGRKVKVEKIIRHEKYNNGPVQHDHDIALFKLSEKLTFHEFLLPVCLPIPNMVLRANISCTVIGWGRRNGLEGADYEPTVNEVQVPVLDRDLCNMWLKQKDVNITEGMICAGYEQGGKDACQGDSGGPLLCPMEGYKDRWFVGGIVSWGVECATPSLPGVYVNVPMYTEWIKNNIHADQLFSSTDDDY